MNQKENNRPEDPIQVKVAKYRELTKMALEKVELIPSKGTKENIQAKMLLQMAENYFSDAQYFEQEAKPPTALAAYSYAHAWLDAGARLGLFKVDNSSDLFTVD